jgi:DNA-binding GntR family transcriptional regulator
VPGRADGGQHAVADLGGGCIAVFETRQVGVTASGQPLRLTISVYPADRNQFSMKTGELAEGG